MVLDGLLDRLQGQDAEDYIAGRDTDAHITVTQGTDVSMYNGPFVSMHRPIDETAVYVEMDDGDQQYREELGSVLMEPGQDGYITPRQAEKHEALEDAATERVEEWTSMLDDAGLQYDRT